MNRFSLARSWFCSFRPDDREDQGNPGRNVVSDKKCAGVGGEELVSTWSILLAWSMPTKYPARSTAGWPANARLSLRRRYSSIDPAARSSAQAPSSLALLSLHELRALTDRLRTRRRVGSTRRRGNHMHDHSWFQRDIDDVTGVSLSLSTSHKSHSRTI